jgi:hypothetical protein
MKSTLNKPLRKTRLLALTVLVSASGLGHAENWPQFRGPTGLGYTPDQNLPLRWDGAKGENVVWKSPLIGAGHASPIVWGDRVFVCTVRWPDGKPEATVIPEHHVVCYAATDGRQLWDTRLEPGPWRRDDFRSGAGGGYAAPTPTTDGQRLFVVFGSPNASARPSSSAITSFDSWVRAWSESGRS